MSAWESMIHDAVVAALERTGLPCCRELGEIVERLGAEMRAEARPMEELLSRAGKRRADEEGFGA